MWCYLRTTKDSSTSEVWGRNFFRCETPWTALTEIATYVLLWSEWCEDTSTFRFCLQVFDSWCEHERVNKNLTIRFYLLIAKGGRNNLCEEALFLYKYIFTTPPIRSNPRGAAFMETWHVFDKPICRWRVLVIAFILTSSSKNAEYNL